jgi:hypothetical protein
VNETPDDESMFAAAFAAMIYKFPDHFGENINYAILVWA